MKLSVCVALTIMLTAFALRGASTDTFGSAVSDDDARLIVGGDTPCGNRWKSDKVGCNGGTALCGETSIGCSSVTFTSLVTDGDGNEKKKSTQSKGCMVCSSTSCGTAEVVVNTKQCTD